MLEGLWRILGGEEPYKFGPLLNTLKNQWLTVLKTESSLSDEEKMSGGYVPRKLKRKVRIQYTMKYKFCEFRPGKLY